MYQTYKEAAEAVAACIHKINPIADVEMEMYIEYLEAALTEDTGGLVTRCDMLNVGIVEGALESYGTRRAMVQTCFPKTWQVIEEIEKEMLP